MCLLYPHLPNQHCISQGKVCSIFLLYFYILSQFTYTASLKRLFCYLSNGPRSFSWDRRSQQSNRFTHKLSPPVPYSGCSFPSYTSRNRPEAYWNWVSQVLPSNKGTKDSADRNQLWCFLTSRCTTAFQRPPHCSFEHFVSPNGTNGWKAIQLNRFLPSCNRCLKDGCMCFLLPPDQLNEMLFQHCCTDNIPDSAHELLPTQVSLL